MTAGSLREKTVLVTGAGSGIGRATAIACAAAGASVAVSDVNESGARTTVEQIAKAGGQAQAIRADVTRAQDVQQLIEQTVKRFGRLDIAVNNAGIEGQIGPTAKCPEEVWDRTIAVNLKGVWLCMKYELPVMAKQRRGSIVNMASAAGLVGMQGLAPYAASKHGIIGLTKTAALEYAKFGIRVNAVCPGLIETPMLERQRKAVPLMAGLKFLQPMGRFGRPEEVAQAVLWLCSDAASLVTGHALTVDGGWTAQ